MVLVIFKKIFHCQIIQSSSIYNRDISYKIFLKKILHKGFLILLRVYFDVPHTRGSSFCNKDMTRTILHKGFLVLLRVYFDVPHTKGSSFCNKDMTRTILHKEFLILLKVYFDVPHTRVPHFAIRI